MRSNLSYVTQMQTLGIIKPNSYRQRYGVSEESFQEIEEKAQGTTATMMRVDTSQERKASDGEQLTLTQSQVVAKLTQAINYQATQFERYRELSEQKFTTLSKDLLDVSMQLKEAKRVIDDYKGKSEVQQARQALHAYQQGDKAPVDMPIDRNGVAPKDVQIDNIFNCSGKRF